MFKYFITYLSYYGPSNQNDWNLVFQQVNNECNRKNCKVDYYSGEDLKTAAKSFLLFCDCLGIPVNPTNGMMTIDSKSTLNTIIEKYKNSSDKMKKLISQYRFIYSYYGKHKVTEDDELILVDFDEWLDDLKYFLDNADNYEIAAVMFFKGNDDK